MQFPKAMEILAQGEGLAAVDALWLIYRLGALKAEQVRKAASASSLELRLATQKVIAAHSSTEDYFEPLIAAGLVDDEPMVKRFAANAAANHTSDNLVAGLVSQVLACPGNDPQLRYALRLALRNHLKDSELFGRYVKTDLTDREMLEIANLCLSLKTPQSAEFLVRNLDRFSDVDPGTLGAWLEFSVQYAPMETLDSVAEIVQSRFKEQTSFQTELLGSVRSGLAQRGESVPAVIKNWASRVATELLGMDSAYSALEWTFLPHSGFDEKQNIWIKSDKRKSEDRPNGTKTELWSSFPKGEQRTGIYRSASFAPGEKFSFFMAGHDGVPSKAIQKKNYIQMRDARSGQVLHKASPPRNDTARKFEWDTSQGGEREVVIELVDGDPGSAYAWFAAGRFSVEALNPSNLPQQRQAAAQLIASYQLDGKRSDLEKLLRQSPANTGYARALASFSKDQLVAAIPIALSVSGLGVEDRQELVSALAAEPSGNVEAGLTRAMELASATEQSKIARTLSKSPSGLDLLLRLVEGGKAGASLLKDSAVAQSITAGGSEKQRELAKALSAGVADYSKELDKLIQSRIAFVSKSPGNPAKGKELFRKHQCAVCHKVGNEGGEIAPNLDGIGGRGLARLAEDIFDPNRNVDKAFRVTSIVKKDGSVITGFIRREEGAQLIMANTEGKEIGIDLKQIKERHPTTISLMPPAYGTLMSETEFSDLMSWLLSLR